MSTNTLTQRIPIAAVSRRAPTVPRKAVDNLLQYDLVSAVVPETGILSHGPFTMTDAVAREGATEATKVTAISAAPTVDYNADGNHNVALNFTDTDNGLALPFTPPPSYTAFSVVELSALAANTGPSAFLIGSDDIGRDNIFSWVNFNSGAYSYNVRLDRNGGAVSTAFSIPIKMPGLSQWR